MILILSVLWVLVSFTFICSLGVIARVSTPAAEPLESEPSPPEAA